MTAPKPFIELNGQNIASYLYGDAVRIFVQNRAGLTTEELRKVHRQVFQQGQGVTQFGVCLSVVGDPRIVQKDDKLLHVDQTGQKTLSVVEKVESTDGRGWPTVYTRTILPKHNADWHGFFPAHHLKLHERDSDVCDYGIYFLYKETGEHQQRERKPSFYEQMMEKVGQLSVLLECWAIVHAPAGTFDDAWSHDSFVWYWATEFGKQHGNKFSHVGVEQTLEGIGQTGDLRGVSRIYNDRNRDWIGRPQVDKITPLMEQMQNDILQRLLEDKTMFERIFSEKASAYWKRRLQVIVEMFNAPRALVISEQKAEGATHQPFLRLRDLDPKKQRQLASIIHIIERTDTEEGLKECARAIYQRIMGRPYESTSRPLTAV